MAREIEGLGYLAQKRQCLYESRKDSLKKEIEQLRDFFAAMEKERELLEGQIKATHALCKKKLVKADRELQHSQDRLRETQNEAATLLEGKQLEMERLQKERDDAQAQTEQIMAESNFFRGYTRYLEEKICVLVAKLNEYHQDLQRKTEEIVESRGRAVEELEWVKHSMLKFEKNLLEFYDTNTQLSSEKEHLMKELQEMKQLEAPRGSAGKSTEGLEDAEKKLHCATQIIQRLQERLQRLECEIEFSNRTAESAASQLNEADATVSDLQEKLFRVQGELQELRGKNLDYVTEKIEADAGAQLREAAISVLRLRIYALESDLQKERDMKGNKNLGSNLKTLTQLSPDVNVEVKARRVLIEKAVKRDRDGDSEYAAAKLEAAKYQLQEDAETIKNLTEINIALKNTLEREQEARSSSCHGFSSDAWSMKKMKKLEQALAEAHERYLLLHKEMNNLRKKKAVVGSFENNSMNKCQRSQQAHQAYLQQYSYGNAEDGSTSAETSEITHQFLGTEYPQCSSTNSFEVGDLKTDENGELFQDLDQSEVTQNALKIYIFHGEEVLDLYLEHAPYQF